MQLHADELALLAAIHKEPQCDTARLVYADWLDERGRPDRAEFIRVQCELENLPKPDMRAIIVGVPTHADYPTGLCYHCLALPHPCRYHALRSRAQELLAGLFPDMTGYKLSLEQTADAGTATVRRGFVEAVVDTAENWAARADAIFVEQPVTAVQLTTWPSMHLDCRVGDDSVARNYYRIEGRERWHFSESLPKLATAGPYFTHRDLLIAEWPTVKTWNFTAPQGNANMAIMLQLGNTRVPLAEACPGFRKATRNTLPRRIIRGIRRLFH